MHADYDARTLTAGTHDSAGDVCVARSHNVVGFERARVDDVKAMILAAGRGERLAPLTDRVPKPLLEVGEETLLERHLRRLAAAGFTDVVVNVSHLGELIESRLGDGSAYGVRLAFSREPDGPLETAGGIVRALPLLGDAPFVLVNADVWTDYPFERLAGPQRAVAHLVLVPNPPHHPAGDFALSAGRVADAGEERLTFAGLSVLSPTLFAGLRDGRRALAPLLRAAAARGEVTGERYDGTWLDVGTPERLAAARAVARAGTPGRPAET